MIDIEWDSHLDDRQRRRHPYHHKNSTIHGWVTKLRGTITGNERVRSSGIEEMRRASRERRRKRRHAEDDRRRDQERDRAHGHSSWRSMFTVFRSSSRLQKPRPTHTSRGIIVNDIRYSSRDHKGPRPFLHPPHRTHAPYHGHGTRFRGYVTGNWPQHATGIAMNQAAKDERERERRRRHRQRRKEGHEMRVDARGSRRRH